MKPDSSPADSIRTLTSDAQLLQDYLKSAGILVSTQDDGVGKVAAFRNHEGEAEAIVIDPTGSMFHVCREKLSDSGWNMYGIGAGFQMIAAVDSATVWAVGNNGGLWRGDHGRWTRTETLPNGNRAALVSAGNDGTIWASDGEGALFARDPAAAQNVPAISSSTAPVLLTDAEQLLNLFCLDIGGGLWTARQLSAGDDWGSWQKLGSPSTAVGLTSFALGGNQDGRLQVFAVGADGLAHTIWQQSPGGDWSAWDMLAAANPAISALAVAQNQDGRLEVFALQQPDSAGNVILAHTWQTAPNGGWNSWVDWSLPSSGQGMTDLAAIQDQKGCLAVVVLGAAGQAAQAARQTSPGNGWSDWLGIGAPSATLSQPALMMNQDGSLEIFALGSDGGVWHQWQDSGNWGNGWWSLGSPGSGPSSLALGRNQDGRLEAFCTVTNGLSHIWQETAGGRWSRWYSLGAPPAQSLAEASVTLNQAGALEAVVIGATNVAWRIVQQPSSPSAWSGWLADWSAWSLLTGAPQLIGMPSGTGASFWAIEFGGKLVSWNGAEWSSLALPGGLAASLLTVDADGTVWVLAADAGGSFFKIVGGAVTPLPDGLPGAASLGAGGESTIWATAAAGDADYRLCTYQNDGWRTAASPPISNMDWNNYPQVSVGRDGGVWLLDGSGNAWAPGTMSWAAKSKSVSFQSLAAANVNNAAIADPDNDAAWGVTAAGGFRRSFGNGWAEPYAALPNGAAAACVSVGRDGSVWAIDNEGGRLYRQASASADPAPAIDGPWTLAAGRNGSGKSYLFCIGTDNQAWVAARGAGANDWLGWSALVSPEPLGMLVAGLDQNQTTDEVFCLTTGGQAFHAWEDAGAPTGWSQLTTLGTSGAPPGTALSWLATGADAASLLHVFGLDVLNNVWVISQQSGSSTGWSDWSAMSPFTGDSITTLSTGNDPGGELEVFALTNTGVAWHSWQDEQAASGWSAWEVLGPAGQPANVSLTAMITANQPGGPLYAVAIGGDGNVYAINGDSSSSTGWSDWYSFGSIAGVTPLSLEAGAGSDGIFFLFLQGSDGAVYVNSLPQGSTTAWSGWAPLGASGTSGAALQSLTAAADSGGVMRVFTVGSGSIWQSYPLSGAATGWADWGRLCGPQPWTSLGVAGLKQAPVGCVGDLWAVFTDGSVRKSPDGAGWTAVPLPGSGAAQVAVSVSVGIDGTVRAATASEFYSYDNSSGAWAQAGAGDFAQAPVGLPGNLWVIDQSGGVLTSSDGGITWIPDASFPEPAKQLSMCADGSVWALDAQGTSWLASRWQRVMRPTGMPGFGGTPPVSEVAAGVDENGTRYIFAVLNQQLYYTYELGRHAWLELIGLGPTQLSGIGLTNQQDTGALIVYAAPRGGSIPYAAKVAGQRYDFAPADCDIDISGLSGPIGRILVAAMDSSELAAIDGDNWCWFCTGSGNLYSATTPASPTLATLDQFNPEGPAGAPRLLRLPWPRAVSAPYCAVLDGSNQIWFCNTDGGAIPLTGQGTPIPNGVSAVAALLQADTWTPPQPRLYALAGGTQTGPNPTLWMLCWSNLFQPAYVASAWSGWVPLGGDYAGLCNGPSLTAADTLFAVDAATDSLDALRQDPITGKWTDGLVKRPSQSGDDIVSVPMYQSEITLCDGNGIPEPKVAVTIFAETPIEAWVNNVLYRLDPVHGVTVPTSALGKLNIKTPANGLHAARLSFQAPGLGGCGAIPGRFGSAGVSLSPSQHVYDFLSGSGSLPVGGGPPTTLTSGALQTLNPTLSSTNAQTVVTDFKTITQMPGTQMPGGATALLASPLIRSAAVEALPGSIFSHLWHDVKHAAESIAHAVEKGVVSAAIDVAGDVVKLTLYIGGELVTAFDMAIHTVEDAVRAIEIIVKKFIADIEEFVEWLMLLFDWRKILETQRALKNWIVQAFPVLQQQMATVKAQASSTFNTVRSDIKTQFASITSSGKIAGYSTFGDLPTTVTSPGRVADARLAGPLGGTQPIAGTSSVHHNWFLTKVLDHITPSFAVPAISGVDATGFIDTLNLQRTIAQIQQMGQDLIDFLTTAFKDPGELKSKGIVDLLNAGEALLFGILDLIEGLIDAFLTLIQQILAGLLDALQQTVDIPVIDDLFKFLTGEDMSALNLGTLLTAVPLYLLYEAAFGGMPFFGAGAEGAMGEEMSTAEALGNTFLVLGIICWFVTGLSNLITFVATPAMTDIPDITPFLGMFNVIVAICMQLAGWPDPNGFPFVSSQTWSPALPFVWGNYALFWVPPLINFFALNDKLSPAVKNVISDVKNVINTIVGWVAMAFGIVAAVLGRVEEPKIVTPAEIGCLVTRPISASLSFLLVSVVRKGIWTASDELVDTAALVFISDLITTLAAPILHDIGAHESAAAPPELPA